MMSKFFLESDLLGIYNVSVSVCHLEITPSYHLLHPFAIGSYQPQICTEGVPQIVKV